jgi:hypothetical protein
MAVKGLTALTLADWGKRVDPNGKVDKIIELLGQTNPILQDMPFVEGNLPTGHRTTIRSGFSALILVAVSAGFEVYEFHIHSCNKGAEAPCLIREAYTPSSLRLSAIFSRSVSALALWCGFSL